MAFIEAVSALNDFKRHRIIRDYAIIGAVAATAYMEPIFTEDIDVVILVDSAEEANCKPCWTDLTMPKKPLPTDSKAYAEQTFREKEIWHRRRKRMSLARKLEALDRMRERPRLVLESPKD